MNRRQVLQVLAAAPSTLEAALAQTNKPQKILALEKIGADWTQHSFVYGETECLLARVSAPKQATPRVLEYGKLFFCATSRVCTHSGCITELPKNSVIHCDCHFSVFSETGLLIGGPARESLPALRLEVRENAIWALGWLT